MVACELYFNKKNSTYSLSLVNLPQHLSQSNVFNSSFELLYFRQNSFIASSHDLVMQLFV